MDSVILLVDDRLENLFALESILEKEGRVFVHATSGPEALLKVRECNPCMVLLDYQMPGMNGLEVAEELRKKADTSEIPLLFITALSKTETKKLQVFEEGTTDLIAKPLDILEVRNRVAILERLHQYKTMMIASRVEND